MEEPEAVGRLLPKIGKEMVRPWKRRRGGTDVYAVVCLHMDCVRMENQKRKPDVTVGF